MGDENDPLNLFQETGRIIHQRNSELSERGEPLIPEPLTHLVSGALQRGYSPGEIADELTVEREHQGFTGHWASTPMKYVIG